MQLALPTAIRPEEVARKQSLGGAIELCAEAAGYALDKQLAADMKVDQAQFSRWQNGTEGIKWQKLEELMDKCGNDAPVLWMFHRRGWDLHSIRKQETETERELRVAKEALRAEQAKNRILVEAMHGRTA